jgi:hypothetical protein
MDIKSFAGWRIWILEDPADSTARVLSHPLVAPQHARQMELLLTVPTLIAWDSCVFDPTKGRFLRDSR